MPLKDFLVKALGVKDESELGEQQKKLVNRLEKADEEDAGLLNQLLDKLEAEHK